MTGREITRACDKDRDRYYDHVNQLFAAGFITSEDELHEFQDRVLKAQHVSSLNAILGGMPLPRTPGRRDMGIPRNYIPPCVAGAVAGLFIGILPSAAMSGMHGEVYNLVTAWTVIVGLVIFLTSMATLIGASIIWDDEQNKTERRIRDDQHGAG